MAQPGKVPTRASSGSVGHPLSGGAPGEQAARSLEPKPGPTSPPGGPLVLTLPEAFVWTAISVALPTVGALLVAAAPRLAAGLFATRPVFALTHAATLGWGSMTVLGAAYQMSRTLLGEPLQGDRWMPWQCAGYLVGSAAIVSGFLTGNLALLAAGGVLVSASAWLFFGVMWKTARRLRKRRASPARARWVHGVAMAFATASFALVTTWGLVLALSFRYPFWRWLHAQYRGLLVHLAIGLVGWFGLMVVGVSYRLVPLVHGVRTGGEGQGFAVVGLLATSAALASTGALAGQPWLPKAAGLMLLPASVLYALEIAGMLRQRRRRAPDLNVDHWVAVLAHGLALGLLGAAWALGAPLPRQAAVVAVILALGGWVTQAILGQLYKITPFLMWHYRAFIPDVLAIPNLPRLYAPRAGRLALWATNLGIAALATGVWAGSPALAVAGAWAFLVGAASVSWLLGYSWIPAVLQGRLRFTLRLERSSGASTGRASRRAPSP